MLNGDTFIEETILSIQKQSYENIEFIIDKALKDSKISLKEIDGIAATAGPGLIGALMVGGGLANGLALAWQCKVIPIHHMEGHLLAPMLETNKPEYPFLALLVSLLLFVKLKFNISVFILL